MLAQLLRDFFFLCSTRRSALVMAEQGVPVHIYHFRLAMKNWVGWQVSAGGCRVLTPDGMV